MIILEHHSPPPPGCVWHIVDPLEINRLKKIFFSCQVLKTSQVSFSSKKLLEGKLTQYSLPRFPPPLRVISDSGFMRRKGWKRCKATVWCQTQLLEAGTRNRFFLREDRKGYVLTGGPSLLLISTTDECVTVLFGSTFVEELLLIIALHLI